MFSIIGILVVFGAVVGLILSFSIEASYSVAAYLLRGKSDMILAALETEFALR